MRALAQAQRFDGAGGEQVGLVQRKETNSGIGLSRNSFSVLCVSSTAQSIVAAVRQADALGQLRREEIQKDLGARAVRERCGLAQETAPRMPGRKTVLSVPTVSRRSMTPPGVGVRRNKVRVPPGAEGKPSRRKARIIGRSAERAASVTAARRSDACGAEGSEGRAVMRAVFRAEAAARRAAAQASRCRKCPGSKFRPPHRGRRGPPCAGRCRPEGQSLFCGMRTASRLSGSLAHRNSSTAKPFARARHDTFFHQRVLAHARSALQDIGVVRLFPTAARCFQSAR